MNSTKLASIGLAAALTAVLTAVSAQAQSPRTFVSAAGNDANPCSFAAPCRHFQAAVNATSLGGEVDALDPAGYSPITISQAITIEGQGWSYIAPPAGGNAITINAVSGNVTLRGLSLNGVGVTGGTNGIVFNSGGSLTVTNCVMQNFGSGGGSTTGNGIYISPPPGTASFAITNTTITNNDTAGIFYTPFSGSHFANGIIDHVTVTGNQNGIDIFTTNPSSGSTVLAISNSIASKNNTAGIFANSGVAPLTVSIDNSTISSNGAFGIFASGTSKMLLGRSVITGNGSGIQNQTSPNTFFTYKDNRINENNTDICSGGSCNALNTTLTLQ